MDGNQKLLLASLVMLFLAALVILAFAQSSGAGMNFGATDSTSSTLASTSTSTPTVSTTVYQIATQSAEVFNISSADGKAKGTLLLSNSKVRINIGGSVFKSLTLNLKTSGIRVNVSITNSSLMPSACTSPWSPVYQFIQINGSLSTNPSIGIDPFLANVTYNFTVPIWWVQSQGGDASSIMLLKYVPSAQAWNPLHTSLTGSNVTSYFYSATSNSLSYYTMSYTNSGTSTSTTSTSISTTSTGVGPMSVFPACGLQACPYTSTHCCIGTPTCASGCVLQEQDLCVGGANYWWCIVSGTTSTTTASTSTTTSSTTTSMSTSSSTSSSTSITSTWTSTVTTADSGCGGSTPLCCAVNVYGCSLDAYCAAPGSCTYHCGGTYCVTTTSTSSTSTTSTSTTTILPTCYLTENVIAINFGSVAPSATSSYNSILYSDAAGNVNTYLYVATTNWFYSANSAFGFLYTNTLWSVNSGSGYASMLNALPGTNTLLLITAGGSNTLYYKVSIPNAQPPAASYNSIITGQVTC